MVEATLEIARYTEQSLTEWRRELINELNRRKYKSQIPQLTFALAKAANPNEFRRANIDAVINDLLEEVARSNREGW